MFVLVQQVSMLVNLEPARGQHGKGNENKETGPGLLNKSSCLNPALGVANFTNVRDMTLVTLRYSTKVKLRCSTNSPQWLAL
jgi:hypothetical protein